MMIIKKRLNKWIDNKITSMNNCLVKRFEYICRSEHLNNCAQNCSDYGISDEKYCNEDIIISLTTYGSRLYEVYLTIESIMQQTMKPNKIILWLSDELKNANIPIILCNQQKRGLEIRYCKDIRAYKKLVPALSAFPSSAIITVDDDALYFVDLIENFINAYRNNTGYIYCARMHRIKFIHTPPNIIASNYSNFQLEKYANWESNYEYFDISPLNFPTGVGGVLYPPHCFNEDVFNESVFMDICRYADDVWYKAMALLNGVMSKKIYTHNKGGEDYLTNENVQDTSLYLTNKSMNDIQIKAVFDKYNLYERLLKP